MPQGMDHRGTPVIPRRQAHIPENLWDIVSRSGEASCPPDFSHGFPSRRIAEIKEIKPKGSATVRKKATQDERTAERGSHRADVRGRRKRHCSMKVIAPPVRQHSLGKPSELRRNGESVRGATVQRRLPTQEKRIPDVEGRLDFIRSSDRAVQSARRSDFKCDCILQ